MKSQPQDQSIQTSCKTCTFALYNENTQTGCAAGRVSKYQEKNKVIEAFDNEKEFYVIRGFCNFYRPPEWNNGLQDVAAVKKEASSTFDIYINCEKLSEDNDTNLIDFLSSIDYPENKYRITLLHNHSSTKKTRSSIVKAYTSLKKKNLYMSSCLDVDKYLHERSLKTPCVYIVHMDCNNLMPSNVLTTINDMINDELNQVIVYKDGDGAVLSSTAYRAECYYNTEEIRFSKIYESILTKIKGSKLYFEKQQ